MRRPTLLLGLLLALTPVSLAGCDWFAAFSPDRGLFLAVATTWDSGIDFEIRIGPTAPVQPEGDPGDAPFAGATVEIRDAQGNHVAKVVSDANGLARAMLAPGTYEAIAQPVGTDRLPSPPAPAQVVVPKGRFVPLQLGYDSGIR